MHKLNPEKIMVTGSRGFIGSNFRRILPDILEFDIMADRRHSVLFKDTISGFLDANKPDVVVHLAANPLATKSVIDPHYDMSLNIQGTLNMLESCKDRKIGLFLYTSTAYIYGEPKYLPVNEDHPANPGSPYGISKYAGEMYCRYYAKKYGIPVVIVRFFNIYGQRQPTGFVIPDITHNILNASDHTVQLKGSEDDTRDFLHVNDLAEALVKVIERKPVGETINLGGGNPVKILDLAKMIAKVTGRHISFECARAENIKISRLYADISKAKKLLGWEPRTDLSKGLQEVVSAIMEEQT